MTYNLEMTVTNTTPDITVDPDNPAVIYVGAETPLPNQLQIQIKNISGGDLELVNVASGDSALIELDFVYLLSHDDVSGIQFSQPDWELVPPAEEHTGDRTIGLHYTGAQYFWADDASLEFTLTNVIASETRESSKPLELDVDDVAGLSQTRYRQPKVAVFVAGEKPLDVYCEFDPADAVVFITAREQYPISNELLLLLQPRDTELGIPATPGETYITVRFDCGNNAGDLMPCADLADLVVDIQDPGDDWSQSEFIDDSPPYWKFTANTNTLFRPGSDGKIRLQLDHIVTQLEEGGVNIYIQFGNVPGYRDCTCLGETEKRPASPKFTQPLSATASAVSPGDPVELSWEAVGTEYCSLRAGGTLVPDAEQLPAKGSFTVYPEQETRYVLQAHTEGHVIQSDLTIVLPDPIIDSFGYKEGASQYVVAGGLLLAWQTQYAEYCQIIYHRPDFDEQFVFDELPANTDEHRVMIGDGIDIQLVACQGDKRSFPRDLVPPPKSVF